jgi:ATP-dependent DNA helicase PIF1
MARMAFPLRAFHAFHHVTSNIPDILHRRLSARSPAPSVSTQDCFRSQFPLTVAYAITVHKSQGITVVRVTLNIKERDFAPGLSYVAVSRVKMFDGLMFEESFDLARFKSKPSKTVQWRLRDIERRQGQHL